jgi:hypothetical protein
MADCILLQESFRRLLDNTRGNDRTSMFGVPLVRSMIPQTTCIVKHETNACGYMGLMQQLCHDDRWTASCSCYLGMVHMMVGVIGSPLFRLLM